MADVERILIIDEVEADAERLMRLLSAPDRALTLVRTLREGVAALDELAPELVIVSLENAEQPGPRAVRMLVEHRPGVRVVAVTARPGTTTAVATMRAGADDYLEKPVDPARLEQAVGRALHDLRDRRALQNTVETVKDRFGFRNMLSRSPKMHEVFEQIAAVAPTDATVLIIGETGTGKELVARAIHDDSPRKDKPYISVNCGAFAEGLLESELFGHERGSFTGAVGRRVGVFELADGGTLFLDELGETSLGVQVNLLRVLEEMSFRRVGGEKPVNVDVRIVTATNVDLADLVSAGKFREDLFYRLNVFPIRLPPLRERREDIPVLLRHFLDDAAKEYGLKAPRIAADAMAWIQGYPWPGNVRQLRALCERWVILARGRTVLREMLPAELTRVQSASTAAGAPVIDEDQALAPQLERMAMVVERAYLSRVLARYRGHIQKSAAHAGIARRTLYNKMKEYGLDAEGFRATEPSSDPPGAPEDRRGSSRR